MLDAELVRVFLLLVVRRVRFEFHRKALPGHTATVGFNKEMRPAFGIQQRQKAVWRYGDGRVLFTERHLDCVL